MASKKVTRVSVLSKCGRARLLMEGALFKAAPFLMGRIECKEGGKRLLHESIGGRQHQLRVVHLGIQVILYDALGGHTGHGAG